MENKEKRGSSSSKARYVWDPNKLAWVEKVEEPPKEVPVRREEPIRREEVARQEKTVPQAEAVRQEVVAEPGIVEDGAEQADVEAEAFEDELVTSSLEYKGALLRLVAVVIAIIILSVIGVIISMIAR